MNHNDKILVSLTAGIAIGSVLGILLTRENECLCKGNMRDKKDALQDVDKKYAKPATLKEEIEQAIKEACAEDPQEYA